MALYYAQQFATTKLSVTGGITDSQTTGIVLQSVTGIDTAKAGVLCLSWSDPLDTNTYEYISYTSINGSNELQGVTRGVEGSTGRIHANLVDVAWVLTESHINNLNAAVVAEHSEAGVHTAISKLAYSTLNLASGQMLNGKIAPSVSSNDLVVALKGMDGNDPSATNPVYIRIGDTIRTLTAARSITLADGTNWFNSGSPELATKEIDYFVYAVWQAADSTLHIGVSRIPYGTVFGDFVGGGSFTDERYWNGSGGSLTSTDNVTVIGRFAATLSAGAGYTWTVPTFTSTNLIQRPIYETRFLSCTGTLTSAGTLPTFGLTDISVYKMINDRCMVVCDKINTSGGTAGAGANQISYTLPIGSSSTLRYCIGGDYVNTTTYNPVFGDIVAGAYTVGL